MRNSVATNETDAVILCGGEGKRLRAMVGRPFLDLLINYVAGFGIRRFILCTGYGADFIEGYYREEKRPLNIVFSREKEPLGTAGAVKNAEHLIKSPSFVVMNGDSLCPLDVRKFAAFHKRKDALISIALAKVLDRDGDYGGVTVDRSGHVLRFDEKKRLRRFTHHVSAGVYIFEKDVLARISHKTYSSLEYDLFPALVDNRFYGYKVEEGFIDIGTPERYKKAIQHLKEKCSSAFRMGKP